MTIDAIMRRHLMRKKASGSIIELIKEKTELQGKLKESMEREAALEAKMSLVKDGISSLNRSINNEEATEAWEAIEKAISDTRPALAVEKMTSTKINLFNGGGYYYCIEDVELPDSEEECREYTVVVLGGGS